MKTKMKTARLLTLFVITFHNRNNRIRTAKCAEIDGLLKLYYDYGQFNGLNSSR